MIQQLWANFVGIFRLSIPALIAYILSPNFTLSIPGIIAISSCLALGVLYNQYALSKREADTLAYVPSPDILALLQKEVTLCGMQDRSIRFGYSYLFDQVAQSIFTTIKIDPVLWKECENDPVKIRIMEVLNTHIMPTVSQDRKIFSEKLNQNLTPMAQRFILRHELGHIAHNDSYKRIIAIAFIVFMTVFGGMATVAWLSPVLTVGPAFILGLCAATVIDLFLSALNNHFIKAAQEKKADIFAASHSSSEEVYAAADFFYKYDQALEEHLVIPQNIFNSFGLPSSYARGYYCGQERSDYLRKAAELIK
ncbi:MAG: M48 family metallopeptidase [Epsilonproteobacteria bacterium]|nr:M48 family metallopeptidase [Campylobacterota bacterium]